MLLYIGASDCWSGRTVSCFSFAFSFSVSLM